MTAQTLEANPNTKKMEAAIYQYFRGVQSLDTQTYVKAFASDGTLEDPAGTAPARAGSDWDGVFRRPAVVRKAHATSERDLCRRGQFD